MACGAGSEESNRADVVEKTTTDLERGVQEGQKNIQQGQEAIQNLTDVLSGEGGDPAVEVVNWRKLQELLPNKAAGLPRTKESGETAGAFGMTFSQAEATFEKNDKLIRFQIVDTGGLGVVINSAAAWSTVTIDREDSNGYERTTTIEGYKAFERYDKVSRHSQLSILVGDRFLVTLEGQRVELNDLRDALDEVNLKKLERME